jgi:WD40 repeat protein
MVHEGNRAGLPGPIYFAAPDEIIVTFVTRVVPSSLPRRDQPDASSPLQLHALFIDARTGQVRTRREWPITSYWSRVVAATGGKFLVLTPDKLTLYAPDLETLKEIDLFLSRRTFEDSRIHRSPDGKSVVIKSYDEGSGHYTFQWIDLDNLRVLRSWTENSHENVWKGTEDLVVSGGDSGSIYDDEMVLYFGSGFFLIRKLDSAWRLVRFTRPVAGVYGFISSQMLVALDTGDERHRKARMTFVRTNGEVLFEQEFPQRGMLHGSTSSTDGRRLAQVAYKGKGGSALLDIGAHYSMNRVMVYDIPSRQWVYTLDAKKQGIKDTSGLALSPDGSMLGLINQDGILELYRIPETQTAPEDR